MKSPTDMDRNKVKPACRRTLPWLLAYSCSKRELDAVLLALVRKHLAACTDCRRAAKEIHTVVGLLRKASRRSKAAKLSNDRRRRIMKSLACSESS